MNAVFVRILKRFVHKLYPYIEEEKYIRDSESFSNFKSVGNDFHCESVIEHRGEQYMEFGDDVTFGHSSFLTAWDVYQNQEFTPSIKIGNHCHFGAYNHITAINQITIGDGCMTGKWVTITDNSHGRTDFCSLQEKPIDRPLYSKGPVTIGKNVWIGDKATILPGVKIGDGVVIGANTVVTKDIPSFHIAVGNPCRILKSKDYE